MENIDFNADSYFRTPSPSARVPFRIHALGGIHSNPLHATRGTFFDDAMLTLVTEGLGVYQRGKERITVKAGMLGLVLPGAETGWLRADSRQPYTHTYCRFAGGEALRMARRIRQNQPAAFYPHPRFPRLQKILEDMRAFGDLGASTASRSPVMSPAEGQLALLLATLLEHPETEFGRRRLTRDALVGYLLDHISEALSLDTMASHFRISKAHLCREGKRLLGDTLQRSAEREKMAWAAALLADTTLPFSIAEVGERVGYQDPLYFSKVFKRRFGLNPRAWRQRQNMDS